MPESANSNNFLFPIDRNLADTEKEKIVDSQSLFNERNDDGISEQQSQRRKIPTATAQIRENLKAPLPLSYINFGVAAFNGFGPATVSNMSELAAEFSSSGPAAVSSASGSAGVPSLLGESNVTFSATMHTCVLKQNICTSMSRNRKEVGKP